MSGFPVHSDGQCAISLWFNNGVQEGDGPILLVVLHCKLCGRANTINVLKEALFVDLLMDDKGASTVCCKPELVQKEKDHLRKALTKCKYPKWAFDKVEKRLNKSTRQATDGGTTGAQPATNEAKNKGHIVIPYTQGLCESIKKICGRYGIQTHFKGGRIIKSLLVSPKDKDPMVNQSGAIYWYQCGDLICACISVSFQTRRRLQQ